MSKYGKVIGKGVYGKVHMSGDSKVVKVPRSEGDTKNTTDQNVSAVREVASLVLLNECKTENVINPSRISIENDKIHIYMPHYTCSLREYIDDMDKYNPLTFLQIKSILFKLLQVLYKSSAVLISHRDVKPDNILIDEKSMNIALCDWGLARFTNSHSPGYFTHNVQSLWYRAPELCVNNIAQDIVKYDNSKTELWSIGTIAYELLTGHPCVYNYDDQVHLERIFQVFGTPSNSTWPGIENQDCFKKISIKYNANPTPFTREITKLKLDNKQDTADCIDFLKCLLKLNPSHRPTLEGALNHDYFNKMRISPSFKFATISTNDTIQIFKNLPRNNYKFNLDFLKSSHLITLSNRQVIIKWMLEVKNDYQIPNQAYHLACLYLDIVLNQSLERINVANLQLLAVSCLLLSSKPFSLYPLSLGDCSTMCQGVFSEEQIIKMEQVILYELKFNLYLVTDYMIFHLLHSVDKDLTIFHHDIGVQLLQMNLLNVNTRQTCPYELGKSIYKIVKNI